MKQIIETVLIVVSALTFISLGITWSVNQWSMQTGFEMTFWQANSILILVFIGVLIAIFIKNILNYNR